MISQLWDSGIIRDFFGHTRSDFTLFPQWGCGSGEDEFFLESRRESISSL